MIGTRRNSVLAAVGNQRIRATIATLLLASLCVFASQVAAQSKHYVELDDLEGLKEIATMELSADGEMLAYIVGWSEPELWVVNTEPGSLPHHLGPGQFPRWSPNGKHLAYYSRQSGTLQFWVFSVDSDRSQPLANLKDGVDPDPTRIGGWIGDPLRYAWSPDSTRLVFASQVPVGTPTPPTNSNQQSAVPGGGPLESDESAPLVLTAKTPAQWALAGVFRSGGFEAPRHLIDGQIEQSSNAAAPAKTEQLFLLDTRSGVVNQLTHDNLGYFMPTWSPDGQRILCVSNESRPQVGLIGSGLTNLYSIDIATGVASALTRDSSYKHTPSWSPNGAWLAYFAANPNNIGEEFLYVLPSNGGNPINVSAKLDRRVYGAQWFSDGNSMAVLYKNGVDLPIARLHIPNANFEIISGAESAERVPFSMTVARSGSVAWAQSDPSGPAVIRFLPTGKHDSRLLVNVEPRVKSWLLGDQEVVRWRNTSGAEMEGVLIKPANYQKGHRYPVVVDAYPKVANGFKGSPMFGNQALASRGYAVFFPNADAPHVWMNPWKSIHNNTAARGPKGVAIAVDDVLSGVDELIRRGIADPQRMCLYGFSNGGGIVNQVVTKTHRFKCAVSVAAATSADWSSHFFLSAVSEGIAHMAGVTPWQDPLAYLDLSAVYRLDRVSTPVLLVDGDNDGSFLLGQIEMYSGLRYLGKDVTFLRYPNQGHELEGPAMKDFWRRENAFFDRYLKSEKPSD